MCMTVGRARSLVVPATFALAIFIASTASHAAETSEAFIVPLFPQKEADLKKGLPPGMTAYSFWAGRGTAKLRHHVNPNNPGEDAHHHAFMVAPQEFDRALAIMKARGVELVKYSDEGHTTFPGRHAYFHDPDGNGIEIVDLYKTIAG